MGVVRTPANGGSNNPTKYRFEKRQNEHNKNTRAQIHTNSLISFYFIAKSSPLKKRAYIKCKKTQRQIPRAYIKRKRGFLENPQRVF